MSLSFTRAAKRMTTVVRSFGFIEKPVEYPFVPRVHDGLFILTPNEIKMQQVILAKNHEKVVKEIDEYDGVTNKAAGIPYPTAEEQLKAQQKKK